MGQVLGKEKGKFSADDINGLNRALFELFDSYDLKDWKRLRNNVTSTLMIDYTAIGLKKYDNMGVEEYMKLMTAPTFLGDPLTKTHHLVGASWYERVSATEAIGHHQIRAAHIIYTDDTLTTEKLKGHAHATNVHRYKKIDGVWKFHGIKPHVHSSEFDFASVWAREPQQPQDIDGDANAAGKKSKPAQANGETTGQAVTAAKEDDAPQVSGDAAPPS